MAKRLLIKPEACMGCRSCELICAYNRTGRFGGLSPAVTIFKNRAAGTTVPLMCMQCGDAACLSACAFGALSRDEATGAVVYDPSKCTMCGMCARACPLGNIHADTCNSVMIKCDLCGGEPKCAQVCPVAAIVFAELPDEAEMTALPASSGKGGL